MKKILILVSFLSVFGALKAQKQEGMIVFDQKTNMHKLITDESIKAMIPEFRTTQHQLVFSANESLYKALEKDDDSDENMGNGGVSIKMKTSKNELYRNHSNQKKIELRELLGKKYLISDTLKTMPWKLSTETKKIKGFDCMKAVMVNAENKKTTVAWFAPEIACPSGPENYGTLPGMILEVNVNDGEMIYTATNVTFTKPKPSDIKQPSEGKPTTPEEFKKVVDEFKANRSNNIRTIMKN